MGLGTMKCMNWASITVLLISRSALGSCQLKKLNFFVKARQQIASRYDQSFANDGTLKMPNLQDKVEHAYHLYPLLIDFQKRGTSKLEFFKNERIWHQSSSALYSSSSSAFL